MAWLAEHESANIPDRAVIKRKDIPCREGQVLFPILNYLLSSSSPP
jgi:hypothetical protein